MWPPIFLLHLFFLLSQFKFKRYSYSKNILHNNWDYSSVHHQSRCFVLTTKQTRENADTVYAHLESIIFKFVFPQIYMISWYRFVRFYLYYAIDQWFSNFFKISTLRSPKIFCYHSRLVGNEITTHSKICILGIFTSLHL